MYIYWNPFVQCLESVCDTAGTCILLIETSGGYMIRVVLLCVCVCVCSCWIYGDVNTALICCVCRRFLTTSENSDGALAVHCKGI